jgi:hypothetical protein
VSSRKKNFAVTTMSPDITRLTLNQIHETMKVLKLIPLAIALLSTSSTFAATGIFGGYLTVAGTKYKSTSSYGGPETNFNGRNFGDFQSGGTLNLTQFETLAFADGGHSTFAFAFAYRVRLSSASVSTNPVDYAFLVANNGNGGNGVSIGGNNEKGEWTGTVNLLSGLSNGTYSIDIVHKAGAWEGGSNFERLANINSTQPGSTSWAAVSPFSASFTVVPEASTSLLGALGSILLLRRRR